MVFNSLSDLIQHIDDKLDSASWFINEARKWPPDEPKSENRLLSDLQSAEDLIKEARELLS